MSHWTSRLPAGREDVAEEQDLLVGEAARDLDRPDVGVGHAYVFGLPARIAAGQVRVAEQAGRGVAEHLVGHLLVAIGALADREIAAPALLALAAGDRERHHDPVADLELVVRRADLDDLAHELVAHDVPGFHPGHEAVVEMQVGAADRAARDLDDRIARRLDPGIGHRVAADVLLAVPAQCSHRGFPSRIRVPASGRSPLAGLRATRAATVNVRAEGGFRSPLRWAGNVGRQGSSRFNATRPERLAKAFVGGLRRRQ